jgi:UDP-N-acetylmuramate--alanine ligase
MNIYFSGIGGIGISALAQFCLNRGDNISGSDIAESVMTRFLAKKGVLINFKQTAENISTNIDLLVYTEAVPVNNPERKRAQELKIPQKSYFEYLGEISRNFRTIAVAGTHGKTTTTGLISAGFLATKVNPTVVVGTVLNLFNGSNFHAGDSEFLIVEACEYRENFRFLNPEIIVLTGIDHDHIDAFPTEESYFLAFEKFIKKAKTVVYHADDENIARVLQNFSGQKIAIQDPAKKLDLKLIGEFNQRNALLAVKLAEVLKLDLKSFTKGLQKFAGAGRRQEFLGEKDGILFYDDYAHHPVEIRELYKGFKEKFRGKKVGMVFEPHQHSRTKELFRDFCQTFANIDKLGIMPIYAARDSIEDKKFTIDNFFRENSEWQKVANFADMQKFLQEFGKNDVVIFCGAGNISDFGRAFLKS